MAARMTSFIKDVHNGKDTWSIVTRVLRWWDVKNKSPPFDVCRITMVLIDAQVVFTLYSFLIFKIQFIDRINLNHS